jgi:TfoX/Sxy family transcriptional regulator of competence genes
MFPNRPVPTLEPFPPNLFSLVLKDTYLTIGQYCVMASMKKGTWPKHSEEVGEVLVEHISHFPAQRKVMFGAPCYFVNGNMFAGVFSDKLFARFSALDRAVLVENGLGDVFEPVPGRAMREYRTLSKAVMDDQRALDDWLGRSYAYVSTLKPKEGKS